MLKTPNPNFTTVFGNKRYSLQTSTLLACNSLPDDPPKTSGGTFLYRTKKGNYFSLYVTSWEFEIYHIHPLIQDEAAYSWQTLPVKLVPFEEAFPEYEVEDA